MNSPGSAQTGIRSIREHGWRFGFLVLAVLAAIMFSCAPSVLVQKNLALPPAYQLKSEHPFADTSRLTIPWQEGERDHGAKLTARVVGACVLYLARALDFHPYLPATIFGLIFLYAGIHCGFALSKDKLVALFFGLMFAGLYATTASFGINFSPKPFDGVALGLLGLTLISFQRHYLLFGTLAFLACWTDEKALLPLFCIGLFSQFMFTRQDRIFTRQNLTLLTVAATYIFSRVLLASAMQWGPPNTHDIGLQPGLSMQVLPLAAWTCFEGGWLIIALAFISLYSARSYRALAMFVATLLTAIICSVMVLDVSRTGAFAYPLIIVAFSIAAVHRTWTTRELRIAAGGAALVSLLAPNFEIVMKYLMSWAPALPRYLLQ